jgi:NitT/TauT family transport system ATP-binding protein
MIEVRNLTFSYKDQMPLFHDFSWHIERGEAWSVIGPSGCGKTTLLYLLSGLLRPTAGEILIDGAPITRPRPQTGLILQDHGLLPWATVRENAWLGFRIRSFYGPDGKHAPPGGHSKKTELERRLDSWLERLGLDGLGDKYPSQLSGGQRQRTAIARSLVLDPDVLLMDEPFSALDASIREDLQQLIRQFHHETEMTIIHVTHDIEEAIFLGEQILVLTGDAEQPPRIVKNTLEEVVGGENDPGFKELYNTLRQQLGRVS